MDNEFFPKTLPNKTQVMWLGDSFGASYLTKEDSQREVILDLFSLTTEF